MRRPEHTAPVALTHPARLEARRVLFGLSDGPLDRFRFVELGCGDGGNLLPLAAQFPAAQFVGIDDDEERLGRARQRAERCGLDHVELVSTEAYDRGRIHPCDFVVAHGSYSWVPPDQQRALLARAARSCAPRGVVYLSYNTLPGWALRGVIRATMLAAAGDRDGGERLTAARSRLTKVRRHLPDAEHPYLRMLATELDLALSKSDAELADDHLAQHNEALFVDELASRAAEHGLAFLTELVPASPDGGLDVELPAKLAQEGLAPLDVERCIDLLCYRQLRASLLCFADAPRRQSADWSGIGERGYFAGRLRVQADEPLLGPGEVLRFETAAGVVVEADRPMLKAALLTLAESWPSGLRVQAVVAGAVDRLKYRGLLEEEGAAAAEVEAVVADLLALARRGQLELWSWTPAIVREVAERPRAASIARLQAEQGTAVTSPRHDPLHLDELGRAVLVLLDGSRDYEALCTEVGNRVDGGALKLQADLAFADRQQAIKARVMRTVVQIRDLGLLAAAADDAG